MIKTSLVICVMTVNLFGQHSVPSRKDVAAIAKQANGAVVSIVVSDKGGHPVAQGSGFLISKDGRVVTNYHVIRSGTSAVIKLPDGAFFVVDGVLASDKDRDVAIIKTHGNNFRTLTLGDSDRLQVGEEVVAIGSPLSLESTVSNGIVSGIRAVDHKTGKLLQITVPISPGSSGGPLFNMAGEVVGITTSHLVGGENLNFAIPIDDVKYLTLLPRLAEVRAFPNEAVEAAGEKDNPSPKFGQTKLIYKDTKPYAFRADCSVVGNIESCVIFNELAGNEDSAVFNTLLDGNDSLVCFMSPESIRDSVDPRYVADFSKRFFLYSFHTLPDPPEVSLFLIYDNGTATAIDDFYLVPSSLDDESFELSGTGTGDLAWKGELTKEVFSWTWGTESGFKLAFANSCDVSLLTGRMTLKWGKNPTFGRCFSNTGAGSQLEASKPAETIARERAAGAAKIREIVAANKKAEEEQIKRVNDCVLNKYKSRCGSCSVDQLWKMVVDAKLAHDPAFDAIAEKCDNSPK
jgi:hypothetical protein